VLRQDAEVYVSLLGESSNNKNALLYYTYDKNRAPASVNDISKLNVVFPNMSFTSSGGSMKSGHRVKLGNFKAGTVIAYCIATNGWKGGTEGYQGITKGKHIIYTNQDFNPENDDSKRQHVVSFCDASKKKFIMGFEDTRRDYGSDEDFNDAIICTSSIPSSAIEDENSCVLTGQTDTDGDGVTDESDEYVNDKTKAFDNKTATGTVSFEDNWPYTGDYDLNDLVIDYTYNVVTNANNQVVRVEGTFTLRATGGAYENGFGIQFPIAIHKVAEVKGAILETGQSKAVLVLFDNMRNQMNNWNTFQNSKSDVKQYNISFNVIDGPTLSAFGLGCYNPFIWNGSIGRGAEIHLPNYAPTDLADLSLLGKAEDATDINSGTTYVSKVNNLPWAIHTPEPFAYPKENACITLAHKKFVKWVESRGNSYPDWYTNQDDYRNNNELHQKK
jgi:LruC domain-containing protein